jgi:primosomal protein N' (replication factor Y)
VTGSGKTEVYLQAIDKVVQAGKQALVLVPEISLTPQAVQRFEARFGSVAVLHSQLTDADRGSHWRRIASGMVPVIVGARSAVFAPTAKLGLIIVDEEHEGSFKQESTPRYHARDLAIVRAQLENVPIVLGSATPSLESWNNARKGTFTLLELPERVGEKPMPPVGIIDMRHEKLTPGMYNAISSSLEQAMRKALDAGGQVILLLNRRGYDTCLFCPDCGQVVKCKFCDVVMTYHRQGKSRAMQFMSPPPSSPGNDARAKGGPSDLTGKAVCHYCGYQIDPPRKCPSCDVGRLRYFGLGTEKLEEELAKKFPGIPAARMDADAMRRSGSHEKTFLAFQQGEIRILFGTQMIAKGLDIPTVTLVGVIYADLALHLPDFRAAERTFQLLAQVAGRAGRGEHGGKVLVQTYHPEHPCIKLASKHDFRAFAESELGVRQVHGFPPIGRLARIIIRGKSEKKVERLAESWAQELQPHIGVTLKVLGPAQAPLKKLEGWYRHHLLVVSATSKQLHAALTAVKAKFEHADDLEFSIDVDPMNML